MNNTGQHNPITDYMDYWMDQDKGFSDLLEDENRIVESVDYYGEAYPRAVITFDDNTILLFPEFNPKFKYK